MVGQPRRNFTKMASWSRASEHLVTLIGMSDQIKWNNQQGYEIILIFSRVHFTESILNVQHLFFYIFKSL